MLYSLIDHPFQSVIQAIILIMPQNLANFGPVSPKHFYFIITDKGWIDGNSEIMS